MYPKFFCKKLKMYVCSKYDITSYTSRFIPGGVVRDELNTLWRLISLPPT